MRARRTDRNLTEIVSAFRSMGISVWIVNDVVDIVLGYGGVPAMVEVKDGAKAASARKLTPRQQEFRAQWKGGMHIVENLNDVQILGARMRKWGAAFAREERAQALGAGCEIRGTK